ncbi:MAG: hypothetical protein CMJ58_25560 [Planctomycetaceae bacterium]|nr:hypothetical protein [Planctomycetaceae bacterium]
MKHTTSLADFLTSWDAALSAAYADIELFSAHRVLTSAQARHFVRVFYHVRGRFCQFLWTLGNLAPHDEFKLLVVRNIQEEFGIPGGRSHEQLYLEFARSLGVDLTHELASESSYTDYAREFNVGHIEWLASQPWPAQFAAFAAYERLDNLDYPILHRLAAKFADEVLFFSVHCEVGHFDALQVHLSRFWQQSAKTVVEAFEFISRHQIKMWRALSSDILALNNDVAQYPEMLS